MSVDQPLAERSEPDPDATPTGLKKVVGASMAGTIVEWYEFFLYGTAATLVFSKIFFAAGTSELDAILAAFVTYAVGFVARPLGGIVFGHYGDKYGRKKLLQFSLVLVGGATFLMGCLPTFEAIGYWAPALLVTLRFIQGFAVGGEWGGAVLLVAEHSPNKSRGFWASWPQAGVPAGNLLATVALLVLTTTLSDEAFLSWGWRVAFWLSAVIVFVGYYIRTKVSDAPIFIEAHKQAEVIKAASYGVFEVVKRYPRGVFTAMGLRFGENVMYYLVVTFSITYLKVEVGTDTSTILWWMLIAHAIHYRSRRAQGPMVAVNCGALPESLLESELFGHERGSFTGATRQHQGKFEQADGGTLFLDEVGEIPASVQVRLLRVLEGGTFTRVGGETPVKVDVRVICATNRDLRKEVQAGTFRADLYYRLHVFHIKLPPLRERRDDIPLLVSHFSKKFSERHLRKEPTISAAAMRSLQAHSWPGNIRELEHFMERTVLLAAGGEITTAQLPEVEPPARPAGTSVSIEDIGPGGLPSALDQVERQLIIEALTEAGGVQAQAARKLGISRSNLNYRIGRLNIRLQDITFG